MAQQYPQVCAACGNSASRLPLLFIAARKNHLQCMVAVLNCGYDINELTRYVRRKLFYLSHLSNLLPSTNSHKHKDSALHWACGRKSLQCMVELLHRGARIDFKNTDNKLAAQNISLGDNYKTEEEVTHAQSLFTNTRVRLTFPPKNPRFLSFLQFLCV